MHRYVMHRCIGAIDVFALRAIYERHAPAPPRLHGARRIRGTDVEYGRWRVSRTRNVSPLSRRATNSTTGTRLPAELGGDPMVRLQNEGAGLDTAGYCAPQFIRSPNARCCGVISITPQQVESAHHALPITCGAQKLALRHVSLKRQGVMA
jgi:hypothetical protein